MTLCFMRACSSRSGRMAVTTARWISVRLPHFFMSRTNASTRGGDATVAQIAGATSVKSRFSRKSTSLRQSWDACRARS